MSDWMKKWMNKSTDDCMKYHETTWNDMKWKDTQRMNEWMSEWMNEWLKKWMIEKN